MQTVILCGGLGTRLREETEFRPKPMVNIGPRPILWHIMKIYSHHGHKDFILSLGYKGDMIRSYFCNYEFMNNDITMELGKRNNIQIHRTHDECGWKITLANTGEATLKGARIKRIEKYITGETFMVSYGDGVSNVDINALLDFHARHGKLATVTGIPFTSRFGELKVDRDQVTQFREKDTNQDAFINGGFFVFNREVFDYLSADVSCDLEYGPLEKIALDGQLMIYRHRGFWACMDTLRDVTFLNNLWKEGKAAWRTW